MYIQVSTRGTTSDPPTAYTIRATDAVFNAYHNYKRKTKDPKGYRQPPMGYAYTTRRRYESVHSIATTSP